MNSDDVNSYAHFTIKYGVVHFMIYVTINGDFTGSPFAALFLMGGAEKRVADPRFHSLNDLKKILLELLSVYEEIVNYLVCKGS